MTPALRHVCDIDVDVGPIRDLGPTPHGRRRIIAILGGTVRGPRLTADIVPGGADWQLFRPDGAIEIDTSYSARTTDGCHVYLRTFGVRSGRPEVLEALLRGDAVEPAEYYFRLGVRLETSVPALTVLEQCVFVASAIR